jgi:hypothetical protein
MLTAESGLTLPAEPGGASVPDAPVGGEMLKRAPPWKAEFEGFANGPDMTPRRVLLLFTAVVRTTKPLAGLLCF